MVFPESVGTFMQMTVSNNFSFDMPGTLDKLQPKFLYWPQSNQNDCTDA